MKSLPVNKELPPDTLSYQLKVAPLTLPDAEIVTCPDPQRSTFGTVGSTGISLTVAITSVRALTQPLPSVNATQYDVVSVIVGVLKLTPVKRLTALACV